MGLSKAAESVTNFLPYLCLGRRRRVPAWAGVLARVALLRGGYVLRRAFDGT